ncbi:MAG: zf-HC2 domain-containing protein [Dehalococcoidia bacterium]
MFWRQRHQVDDATLNAFVDGELGEAERVRVDAHIETCAACAATVDELRSLGATLSELPRARAPRSFALREGDVRQQPAPRWEVVWRRWQPALSGVAVTAFAAFFLLVGVDVFGAPSRSGGDLLTAGEDAEAPAAEATGVAGELQEPDTASGAEADDAANDREVPDTQYNDGLSPAAPTSLAPDGNDSAPDGEADDRGPSGFIAQPGSSPEGPVPSPESSPTTDSNGGGGGDVGLRVAEGVTAAVALTAGGSLAFVWWRRRTD